MKIQTIMPAAIVLGLGAGAAWLEYGQYSTLMLNTASADVTQLCAQLLEADHCPAKLTLSTRAAVDPWSRPYRCRTVGDGVLIYSLGADGAAGGKRRDADIACTSAQPDESVERSDRCVCRVGGNALALAR